VPSVSSVSQPTQKQGEAAVEYLLARIERPEESKEPRRLSLDCTLIARQSSGRVPKAKTASKRNSTKKS
ncbi:MAG: substrate-binding domain-containing protein, partial [Myxococcota bacterium]